MRVSIEALLRERLRSPGSSPLWATRCRLRGNPCPCPGLAPFLPHRFRPGVFVAARYAGLDFNKMDDGLGTPSSRSEGGDYWDFFMRRYEGSVGYRLARNAGLMASWFRQTQYHTDQTDAHLAAVRLWWAF